MPFKEELEFFINHQDELVRLHAGKTLVIKGNTVVGIYNTPLDAYLDAQKEHELGTFMIQRCEPGPEAYTITVSSLEL